jgi:hypothetical protein
MDVPEAGFVSDEFERMRLLHAIIDIIRATDVKIRLGVP